MSFKEVLSENIRQVLPHLGQEKVNETADFLLKEGVKKLPDLKHINVSMLKQVLDTIDSCELNANWQNTYNAAGSSSTNNSSGASNSSTRSSRPPLQDIARGVINTQLPTFDVNSSYMPTAVKEAVKDKTRPTAKSRTTFVERIVDKCRECVPNIDRSIFHRVGLEIVNMYPDSFKDTLPVSDHGADSLIAQLKNKFDNDRRPQRRKTAKEVEVPSGKQAFGCISWNPKLPTNRTLDCLVAIRIELQTFHKISRRDWNWRVILTKIEESFYLQRKEINGTLVPKQKKNRRQLQDDEDENEEAQVDDLPKDMTITELNVNWPFLFTSKGINKHFQLLTGVDFEENLSEFLNNTVPDLIEFFTSNDSGNGMNAVKRRMQRAEKQGHGNTPMCGVLLMLLEYFKVEKDELLIFVEATTTLQQAETSTTIQYPEESTPFLIFAGTSIYDFEQIFFSIDKKVLSSVKSVFDAIVILFSSYYVFNYVYNTKLSSFLLYIQRIIAGIQPASTGSKCVNAQVLRKSNDKISKLSNKFQEAVARWRAEDKEN